MATKFTGSTEKTVALDSYIKLMRAADTVAAHIREELLKENLTISQIGVLEAIMHLGPMRQNELCKKLLKTGGNITKVIDNLEKRNLVKRVQGQDRRCYQVELTESGSEFISSYFPKHVVDIENIMGRLTTEEQKELQGLCKKLGLSENPCCD